MDWIERALQRAIGDSRVRVIEFWRGPNGAPGATVRDGPGRNHDAQGHTYMDALDNALLEVARAEEANDA